MKCLALNERFVLATAVSRQGSGPREPGAMMLIFGDGGTAGTVGGGPLEAAVLEAAEEVLRTGRARLLSFDLTGVQAPASGMICGGRMEILLEAPDGSNPAVVRIWERVIDARRQGGNSWLVRSLACGGDRVDVAAGLGLLEKDRCDAGTLDIPEQDMERIREQGCRAEPVMLDAGGIRCFVQPVLPAATVFIFGAGHVAGELAQLCAFVGLRTVIIDDRREFANEQRFPRAADIRVCSSFTGIFDELEIGPESFVVIVTRGHMHDRDVLSRALKTPAGYIGMISSRRKRDTIYRSLLEDGVDAQDLKRVRSPIGLDIGARTPAEIAVSIAAELIAVRAGHAPARVL